MGRTLRDACVLLLAFALVLPFSLNGQTSTVLVATGSSMPEPLYVLWNAEYHKQQPAVQVRYLPEGTGASAVRILSGSGDFGGGDAPIPGDGLKNSANKIVELPAVLIGIVMVYNLPTATRELRLSGPVLADIFLGKITAWNDPALAKLNPEMKLPALPIQVIHRTEGKGSNYILSDFLSKVSPEFLARAGRSESPRWPVGVSQARSQELIEKVRATNGAIGYTELNLAAKSGLRIASVRNAAGEFVRPSAGAIAAAAVALQGKMTEDFRVSITNAPGKESYPISSFTWLYVPATAKDAQRGRAVADYLKWVYTTGQKIAQEQGYAPLPGEVLAKVASKAATIR